MPTIKDKLRFNFNGVWSDTHGVINISLDNGMYEEALGANMDLIETKMRGNSKPILHSIEESPLEFEMVIAFQNGYTDTTIDNIIKWLFVKSYKPLYFEGRENRIFMAMPIGQPSISHNGLKQGYFTVQMRCDSANVYSPTTITSLQTVVTNATYTIVNDGHTDAELEISIKKKGEGNIVIESLDDGGNIFEVWHLTNLENIYINCNKEIIETDAVGIYRYDDIIGEFPRMILGDNRFKVTGACDIQFRYKNKYKF